MVENNHGLIAYSDASWRSKAGSYSSYGYVIYLFGGVVSFASKYLKVVALSSAEAEYAAASQTCRELTFVRKVCTDLGLEIQGVRQREHHERSESPFHHRPKKNSKRGKV